MRLSKLLCAGFLVVSVLFLLPLNAYSYGETVRIGGCVTYAPGKSVENAYVYISGAEDMGYVSNPTTDFTDSDGFYILTFTYVGPGDPTGFKVWITATKGAGSGTNSGIVIYSTLNVGDITYPAGYCALIDICDSSLPVELSSFTAIPGDGQVTLRWTTESEIDNLDFEILRSLELEGEYRKLPHFIDGAGNSTSRNEYQFTDGGLTNGITYYYKLVDVDFNGNREEHGPVFATPHSSEIISEEPQNLPNEFSLYQNYPNPFNPNTTIRFDLAQSERELGEAMYTELRIFDILGKEVRVLVNENLGPGRYLVQWDGRDKFGERVTSSVYLYILRTPSYIETKKMIFVK